MLLVLLLFLLVCGLCLLAWMQWGEPRCFQINRYDISLPRSISANLKILHLTDTHFAKGNKPLKEFIEKKLSKEEVDLVFLTGDIMDCEEGIYPCIETLTKLKPRYGIYAVFGNHDYYDFRFADPVIHNFPGQGYPSRKNRVEMFERELENAGINVLMNRSEKIEVNDQVFWIHGLDDPTTNHADYVQIRPDLEKAGCHILLSHSVDAMMHFEDDEIDLVFSGHSHGGQIRFPLIGPIVTHTQMGKRYAAGIHELNNAICCISRGMAASRHFQFRLLCPPEAIVIDLKKNG